MVMLFELITQLNEPITHHLSYASLQEKLNSPIHRSLIDAAGELHSKLVLSASAQPAQSQVNLVALTSFSAM